MMQLLSDFKNWHVWVVCLAAITLSMLTMTQTVKRNVLMLELLYTTAHHAEPTARLTLISNLLQSVTNTALVRLEGFTALVAGDYDRAAELAQLPPESVRDNPSLEVPKEHEEMFKPAKNAETDPRPLLVIADSRGRVRCWDAIQKWPYMRDVLALCSSSTPPDYLSYLADRNIGTIITGKIRIDMRSALEALNARYGVKVVRVDSGGTLNSVLLLEGLVDEVSVLIHPVLAGGEANPTLFDPLKTGMHDVSIPLWLQHYEVLEHGIIWARYMPRKIC